MTHEKSFHEEMMESLPTLAREFVDKHQGTEGFPTTLAELDEFERTTKAVSESLPQGRKTERLAVFQAEIVAELRTRLSA